MLIHKNMKKSDLKEKAGISSAPLAKLGKGDNMTTDVLLRICEVIDYRRYA
jgi:DNA-binding Xre family transcriptional regulator